MVWPLVRRPTAEPPATEPVVPSRGWPVTARCQPTRLGSLSPIQMALCLAVLAVVSLEFGFVAVALSGDSLSDPKAPSQARARVQAKITIKSSSTVSSTLGAAQDTVSPPSGLVVRTVSPEQPPSSIDNRRENQLQLAQLPDQQEALTPQTPSSTNYDRNVIHARALQPVHRVSATEWDPTRPPLQEEPVPLSDPSEAYAVPEEPESFSGEFTLPGDSSVGTPISTAVRRPEIPRSPFGLSSGGSSSGGSDEADYAEGDGSAVPEVFGEERPGDWTPARWPEEHSSREARLGEGWSGKQIVEGDESFAVQDFPAATPSGRPSRLMAPDPRWSSGEVENQQRFGAELSELASPARRPPPVARFPAAEPIPTSPETFNQWEKASSPGFHQPGSRPAPRRPGDNRGALPSHQEFYEESWHDRTPRSRPARPRTIPPENRSSPPPWVRQSEAGDRMARSSLADPRLAARGLATGGTPARSVSSRKLRRRQPAPPPPPSDEAPKPPADAAPPSGSAESFGAYGPYGTWPLPSGHPYDDEARWYLGPLSRHPDPHQPDSPVYLTPDYHHPWFTRGDLLLWSRQNAGATDFGYDAGFQLTVGYSPCETQENLFTYRGVYLSAGNYDTNFHDLRFDLRRQQDPWGELSRHFTLGFRYLMLLEDNGPNQADNHMFGPYFGLEAEYPFGHGRWVSLYGNAALLPNIVGADAQNSTGAELASVLEVGIQGRLDLGPRAELYSNAGIIFLSGVGLATNQGRGVVDTSGSAYFHGISGGLRVRW